MKTIRFITLLSVVCLCLVGFWIFVAHHTKSQPKLSVSDDQQLQRLNLVPIATRYEYGHPSFSDLAITNDHEVWAVGYNGHDPKIIWHSSDAANTWEEVSVPDGGFVLRSINFIDQQHGWAVGESNILIRTTNGGGSWEQIKLPDEMDWSLVHFVNPNIGYITGSIGVDDRKSGTRSSGIEILRTNDGGKSWQICYKDDKSGNAFQISALSDKIAIVAVEGHYLLRTEDGGDSWQIIIPPSGGVTSVKFNSNGTAWIVGNNGCFYLSIDKGKTWQRPTSISQNLLNRYWNSIDFFDAKRGIAVGDRGAIAITNDGGNTWLEKNAQIAIELSSGQALIKEHLRKVWLTSNSGLILGSQRLYKLNVGGTP